MPYRFWGSFVVGCYLWLSRKLFLENFAFAVPSELLYADDLTVITETEDDLIKRLNDTHTQPFNGLWSGTTRVGRYQKKHSPTHTHPDHRTSFIIFLHLQWSMASSLFISRAWQSSCTTSLQVLFGLPFSLGPSTSYSMHFFTQSLSSFRSTCPYQRIPT